MAYVRYGNTGADFTWDGNVVTAATSYQVFTDEACATQVTVGVREVGASVDSSTLTSRTPDGAVRFDGLDTLPLALWVRVVGGTTTIRVYGGLVEKVAANAVTLAGIDPTQVAANTAAITANTAAITALTTRVAALETAAPTYALSSDLSGFSAALDTKITAVSYSGSAWPVRPTTPAVVDWIGGTGVTPPGYVDGDIWDEPNVSVVNPYLARWTAEGGTVGNSVVAAETGSGDPLDVVAIATGESVTYSSTQPFQGTKAARLVRSGTGVVTVAWRGKIGSTTPTGTLTGLIFGAAIYLDALPASATNQIVLRIRRFNGATYDPACYLRVTSTGAVELRDSAGTLIGTASAAGVVVAARYTTFELKASLANNSVQARIVPYSAALVAGAATLLGDTTTTRSLNVSFDDYQAGLIAPNAPDGAYVDEMRAKPYDATSTTWCF